MSTGVQTVDAYPCADVKSSESDHAPEQNSSRVAQGFRARLRGAGNNHHRDLAAALKKLTAAAWLYDKNSSSSLSVNAFDVASVSVHEFRDLLKRIFHVKLTDTEFHALANLFGDQETGAINSHEFLLTFTKLGAESREAAARERRRKKLEAGAKKQQIEDAKRKAIESKNQLKVSYSFTQDDSNRVMTKLTSAATLYARTSAVAVQLDAFASATMEPHELKEQLKRAFNLTVSATELGALVSYFDANGTGGINCADFVSFILRIGMQERDRARKEWRAQEIKHLKVYMHLRPSCYVRARREALTD
jgi:Ca2+-binding EF-hand superfamily protein